MKRSTYIYLVLLLLIGSVAVALMTRNRNSTLPQDMQDFAVDDTARITKIELSDRNNHAVVLERKSPGSWTVNKKFNAQKSQVDILLETIKQVQVKNPVPMSARDNVIKTLASEAVKVRIFKNDDPVKTYYVGGTTPDELGTLMLLENAKEPFVTYIPGFDGYLNTRYITNEKDWRSTEIYHLNPAEITNVEVEYPSNLTSSFSLDAARGQYTLTQKSSGTSSKMDEIPAKRYLAGYRGIDFEGFAGMSTQSKDSLMSLTPLAIINVKSGSENAPELRIYSRHTDSRSMNTDSSTTDPDHFYGIIGNSKEVVTLQSLVVGKLLPGYSELKAGK
jgi:hypothetical protein